MLGTLGDAAVQSTETSRPRWDVWNKTKQAGTLKVPSVRDAQSSHANISGSGMHFVIRVKV